MVKVRNIFICIFILIFFLFVSHKTAVALYYNYCFEYEIIENEAIIIDCYNKFDEIPDTIDGYSVTKIGEKSFASATYDKSLLIPDTIREIGNYAFACEIGDGIWDITVPKGVTKIGRFAIGYVLELKPIFDYDGSIIGTYQNPVKFDDMVIRGYKGTAAETYAKQNGFEFVYLDDEPEVTTATTATTQTTTTSTTVSTTATSMATTETTKASISTPLTTTTSATTVTTNSTTTISTSASTSALSTSGSTTNLTTPLTKASTSVTTSETTTVITNIKGDANGDNKLDVRDAACIAKKLAQDKAKELPKWADFNEDGTVNVRDAAAIARYLALRKS